MSAPTYYDLLKVTPDAPSAVIRASWRALAFAHHPDRLGNDHDHADMAAINQAYEILIDPARRALYDLELQRAAVEAMVRKAPRRSPPAAMSKPVPPPPAPAPSVPSGQRGLIERVDVFWPMHLSAVPEKMIPGSPRLWAAAGAVLLCALSVASWWVEHRDAERLHTMSLMQHAGAAREAGFMPNLDRDALVPVAQERPAGGQMPGRAARADAAVLTWTPAPALASASIPASQAEPPKSMSADGASSASRTPSGAESSAPSPAAMAEVQALGRGSRPPDGESLPVRADMLQAE